MAEEPDLDRIKRLLADVARSVGIPGVDEAEPQQATPGWHAHAKDTPRACASSVTDERLVTAVGWMRARDERDRVFGADLFFDPAWNMLLDLYVNGGAARWCRSRRCASRRGCPRPPRCAG